MLKSILINWAFYFGAVVLLLALYDRAELTMWNISLVTIVTGVLASLSWLQFDWAPEFSRKRNQQRRKNEDGK